MTTAAETPARAAGRGELVPAGDPEPDQAPVVEPAPLAQPEPMAETAAEIEEIDADAPRVAILAEDHADLETMERAPRRS